MITILGPTATGKTKFAAKLCREINGEIISADSRQVYRGMDLGTGKDFNDYFVDGKKITYHLIDIKDPGYEYSVYEFQSDFLEVYKQILRKKKMPVLCGGTGLYLEAVLMRYDLAKVPVNEKLRKEVSGKSMPELIETLQSLKELHNLSDIKDKKRLIRAIEIGTYYKDHPEKIRKRFPDIPNIIFGIYLDRSVIRERITRRLRQRLDEGMIDEVRGLLNDGFTAGQLMFYGLEYKYLTLYVTGEISYNEMFSNLNTAIHQFAKRQMTWFRRMEKKGVPMHWIDGNLVDNKKVKIIKEELKSND